MIIPGRGGVSTIQVNRRYETSGQTPLQLAASDAFLEAILALLEAGAKLEVACLDVVTMVRALQEPDCVRQTALHYSLAASRATGAAQALLRYRGYIVPAPPSPILH